MALTEHSGLFDYVIIASSGARTEIHKVRIDRRHFSFLLLSVLGFHKQRGSSYVTGLSSCHSSIDAHPDSLKASFCHSFLTWLEITWSAWNGRQMALRKKSLITLHTPVVRADARLLLFPRRHHQNFHCRSQEKIKRKRG